SKFFNKKVGLISAFLFCLTPIVVAVSRNNTMDMQLILVLLIAVFFVLKSIQTNKWRWLIIAGVLLGLGFNIKMLQAYLIVPSIIIAYLIFSKQKIWKRFAAGILSCLVMIVVSCVWIAAVALTPAENRPYVDSTTNNSIVELIFGHNGTDRLFGDGASLNNGSESNSKQSATNNNNMSSNEQDQTLSNSNNANSYDKTNYENNSYQNPNNPNSPPMGGGHTREIGNASLFRLWNNSLFGQASWLLIFALVSLAVCLRKKLLISKNINQCVLLLFGCWVVTAGLFFSFAGFFHAYYLSMIAPPIAMLSAIGINYIYEQLAKKEKSKKIDKRLIILLLSLIIDVIIS
ncbi:MAG: glycosyltransferase family 39 protein, partial [Oscillospiraceae bacterium]|nr:glycosyltransferase family 39 protein [Oscillospiraceae bacterium]